MCQGIVHIFQQARTGNERNIKFLRQFLTTMLEAEFYEMFRSRSDKGDPVFFEDFREFCVFTQEAVTRMNRLGPRRLDCIQNRGNIQIAILDRCGPDTHGLVGHQHMGGRFVRI